MGARLEPLFGRGAAARVRGPLDGDGGGSLFEARIRLLRRFFETNADSMVKGAAECPLVRFDLELGDNEVDGASRMGLLAELVVDAADAVVEGEAVVAVRGGPIPSGGSVRG
jgi:hypothetical protein